MHYVQRGKCVCIKDTIRGKAQQNFQNEITSSKHPDNKTFTRIACKRFEKIKACSCWGY